MDVKAFYEAIGGNYDEAIGRLMRDSMIEKYVKKFVNDQTFETLRAAIQENRVDDAFAAAHTLKGVAMNFAFATLSRSATKLTDSLRPQNRDALTPGMAETLFADVQADYEAVIAQIERFASL